VKKVDLYRFQKEGAMGDRVEGEDRADAELGWVRKDLLLCECCCSSLALFLVLLLLQNLLVHLGDPFVQ